MFAAAALLLGLPMREIARVQDRVIVRTLIARRPCALAGNVYAMES
jgi:hypothetical protein